MWTSIIGIIAQLGMWWLDRSKASVERKKLFLAWVAKNAEMAQVAPRMRGQWNEILEQMKRDDEGGGS